MFFLTGVISPFQREDHLFRACFSKFSFFLSPLSTVLLLGFSVFLLLCIFAFLFLASTSLFASLFFCLSVLCFSVFCSLLCIFSAFVSFYLLASLSF